ncbi:hypothetical protein WICMUC_001975 [Wickerhamomyces mucosus]|uniref:protein-serine/threonine phosphatase n=1 Tax=Wickerhamomyces mucosus TaxID=1378264 RepID=A0A9P8PTL4_9ASCO|nr:hypothetical protein WICMUC_001975 [Wickerhamomyces mucosus]
MGQILSQPVTTKHSESNQDKFLAYGLSSMQGWRINMEDAHTTILNLDTVKTKQHDDVENDDDDDDEAKKEQEQERQTSAPNAFFGVYDGHGGDAIAKFTGDNLFRIVKNQEEYSKGNFNLALKNAFLAADREILQNDVLKNDQSGCTATTVLVDGNRIVCANAGDSRTVLSVNGYAKPLSYDHKPNNEGEHARICAAGGFVDIGRVNGNLALSRAIGDFDFKKSTDLPAEEQIVTAFPDVIEHDITSNDEFIVLACDGIWDCLSSQQVVEIVRRGINDSKTLVEIAEGLVDICLAPTSGGSGIGCDNMSVVIVALLQGKTLEQWQQSIIDKGGPISKSFDEVSNEIYSEEERQNGFQNQLSEQSNSQSQEDSNSSDNLKSSFSIQQLLEQNVLTSQNGVFYLDSSNILSSLGVQSQDVEESEEQDEQSPENHQATITEVEDEDEEQDK